MLLQQLHHREGREGGHQRRTFLKCVLTPLDVGYHAGVGTGPADARLFHELDQRGLGQAGRWLGAVLIAVEACQRKLVATFHRWQHHLAVRKGGLRVVAALYVHTQEAWKIDDVAVGLEQQILVVHARGHLDHHAAAAGLGHLAGHGALPDHLVQARLVVAQSRAQLIHRGKGVSRRAYRFMGLLGILDLVDKGPRLVGHEVLAVELAYGRPRGLHRVGSQRHRVGSHISNKTELVEPLRRAHGPPRVKTELAPALLLQGRSRKWRSRRTLEGFLLGAQYRVGSRARSRSKFFGLLAAQQVDLVA